MKSTLLGCTSVFYNVICVEESDFSWIRSISSKDCGPVSFTELGGIFFASPWFMIWSMLGQFIPEVKLVGLEIKLGCYTRFLDIHYLLET